MSILLSLLAGVVLGCFFYGGLWLTVRSLPESNHPALIALASFWIRSLIAVAGLLLLMKTGWHAGLAAAIGFALGRLVVARSLPGKGPAAKCT